MLLMLGPMAPHIAHEAWEQLGYGEMLASEPWPAWDPELVRREVVTMVVQVNGKVRDRTEVPADVSEEEAERIALGLDRIQEWTAGKEIRQVIVRAPRLVNVVVS
jgi:leucyl-tRNA synthetase